MADRIHAICLVCAVCGLIAYRTGSPKIVQGLLVGTPIAVALLVIVGRDDDG